MTLTFPRLVTSGILAVWGAVLSYFYFSGRIGSYLHPSFHLWTVLCGGVLVVMALAVLLLPEAGDENCDDDCGHVHGGGPVSRAFTGVILVVPLVVAAYVSPSQFSASTVLNRGYIQDVADLPGYQPFIEPALPTEDGSVEPGTPGDAGSYLARNERGVIQAQTADLLYAAQEPTMREDFENKDVELVGQFMPARSNNARGDRFDLVRMYVMCCAADARPVAILVQGQRPENFPEMSWVKVTGKATFPLEGGRRIPVIQATSVIASEPPPESFIY